MKLKVQDNVKIIRIFVFCSILFFDFSPIYLQAVQLAQDIRDRERGGRADIVIVEGAREKETPEAVQMMADVLGQKPAQLRKAIPDNKDEQEQNNNIRLYQ